MGLTHHETRGGRGLCQPNWIHELGRVCAGGNSVMVRPHLWVQRGDCAMEDLSLWEVVGTQQGQSVSVTVSLGWHKHLERPGASAKAALPFSPHVPLGFGCTQCQPDPTQSLWCPCQCPCPCPSLSWGHFLATNCFVCFVWAIFVGKTPQEVPWLILGAAEHLGFLFLPPARAGMLGGKYSRAHSCCFSSGKSQSRLKNPRFLDVGDAQVMSQHCHILGLSDKALSNSQWRANSDFLFHFHRWNQKEGEKTRFSVKNDQLEALGLVLLSSCVLTQAMGAVVAPGPDATSESLPWMFHTWPCVYFWRFAAWVQINKASPAQAAGWGGAAAGFGDNAGKGQGNGNTGQIFHINQRSKSCNQCCYFWWVNSGCLTLGIVWFCWSGMEWRHLFIQPAGI